MGTTTRRLYYKGNRLPQLRAFCQVASWGSLSKAARSLFLHQPTLSLQIQALERELGVRLFERQPRGLALTPAGHELLQLAKPLVDTIDCLEDVLGDRLGKVPRDIVEVAASRMSARRVLPEILAGYSREYPGIRLRVLAEDNEDVLRLVLDEAVDFGFGPAFQLPEEVEFITCVNYGMAAIVNRQHALANRRSLVLEEVAAEPLILFQHTGPSRIRFAHWLESENLTPRIVLEVGEWDVVLKYVQMGFGMAITNEGWVDEEARRSVSVLSVPEFVGTTSYGIILKRGEHVVGPARHLMERIVHAFR